MKAEELFELLVKAGIKEESIHILDTTYDQMTKQFALTEFAPNFEKLKGSLGRNEYTPNVWDCDKFALLAHWYAQLLNSEHNKENGIVFGTFTYLSDNALGYHQINILIASDTIMFFEPQDSSFLTLSQTEIESCTNLNI